MLFVGQVLSILSTRPTPSSDFDSAATPAASAWAGNRDESGAVSVDLSGAAPMDLRSTVALRAETMTWSRTGSPELRSRNTPEGRWILTGAVPSGSGLAATKPPVYTRVATLLFGPTQAMGPAGAPIELAA